MKYDIGWRKVNFSHKNDFIVGFIGLFILVVLGLICYILGSAL